MLVMGEVDQGVAESVTQMKLSHLASVWRAARSRSRLYYRLIFAKLLAPFSWSAVKSGTVSEMVMISVFYYFSYNKDLLFESALPSS